jgi:hypothetical protein
MDPAEWFSYFYLIMEAQPVSKTLCSFTKHETMGDVQYICRFTLEILANLEVPSPYKCLTCGTADATFDLNVILIFLEKCHLFRNMENNFSFSNFIFNV